MNIFRIYLSQNCIKIYNKTHQIASFKKLFSGDHAPEIPYQVSRHANLHKLKKMLGFHPLANPAYADVFRVSGRVM